MSDTLSSDYIQWKELHGKLRTRTINALVNAGITTWNDLATYSPLKLPQYQYGGVQYTPYVTYQALLRLPEIGKLAIKEIAAVLKEHGYDFGKPRGSIMRHGLFIPTEDMEKLFDALVEAKECYRKAKHQNGLDKQAMHAMELWCDQLIERMRNPSVQLSCTTAQSPE